jgi:hypothetical protein
MENVNEFLDYTPLGLEKWMVIDGEPIYSSNKIIKMSELWLKRSPITNNIYDKIREGLDMRAIVIGYENKSKIKFLASRFEGWVNQKLYGGVLGYYDKYTRTVAILLDKHVSLMGESLINIPSIMVHELVHYTCSNNWKTFYQYNAKTIMQFYKSTFDKYLPENVTISDKNLLVHILTLSKYTERNDSIGQTKLAHVLSIWTDFFMKSGLDEYEADKYARITLAPYVWNFSEKADSKALLYSKQMGATILKTYKEMFPDRKTWKYTVMGQEFTMPSEIIALINQDKIEKSMVNVINSTDFRRF